MKLPRICFAACLFATVATSLMAAVSPSSGDWTIVSRKGDKLYEGDREFRFLGLDSPNLLINESQLYPDMHNRFPDEFEMRDTLAGLQYLGTRATRTFTLSIAASEDKGVPVYITGLGTYNEEAFRALDRLLALCKQYDVRLIIPIVASQQFYGIRGVDQISVLSGKPAGSFWTDERQKSEYKALLRYLVNRRNTVDGLLYKDEPAILAWQFGNEFDSYAPDRKLDEARIRKLVTDWSLEMSAYLKSIDPKHLIIEAGGDKERLIADPNIDIISIHLYEYWAKLSGYPGEHSPEALRTWSAVKGHKALIIDEFGMASFENNRALMETIRKNGITGGLLWSIRAHRRDGGWYCHNEGGSIYNSYHVPGFATGRAYDEEKTLDLLRSEAFAIRGLPVPPVAAPSVAPVLIRVKDGFSWRGSALASHYSIARAPKPNGPWTTVATGLVDSVVVDAEKYEASGDYLPPVLWSDEYARSGETWYYRVQAHNAGGDSDESPVVEVRY